MKNKTYMNAIDHLKFSSELEKKVMERAVPAKPRLRVLRTAAAVALVCVMLMGTAFAVSPEFRSNMVELLRLGTAEEDFDDAQVMDFTESDEIENVSIHYMKLGGRTNYTVCHGMLYDSVTGFQRIAENYQLEQVEMESIAATLEKNDRQYTLDFAYLETDEGILSEHKKIYQANENGELFLNATDGNSGQWPVYADLATGQIRDALPDWTSGCFEGRVAYADQLKGGILISTIVNDGTEQMREVVENGVIVGYETDSYNLLYWIGDGAEEARMITLPETYKWTVENDTIYCQDRRGWMYRMDENFEFELISDDSTGDDLTNGLLTVATSEGKLGILDVITGESYVIDEISVSASDLDETMGYNATRYGTSGRIALIQTDWIPEESKVMLLQIGILDQQTGQLKMLEISNEFDGYQNGWLDENRLAVIYKNGAEQYLCVYEFSEE